MYEVVTPNTFNDLVNIPKVYSVCNLYHHDNISKILLRKKYLKELFIKYAAPVSSCDHMSLINIFKKCKNIVSLRAEINKIDPNNFPQNLL